MRVIYESAAFILRKHPARHVVVDGRPYAHAYQVRDLLDLILNERIDYRLVECVCAAATARKRLEQDVQQGKHLAADRNFELYLKLKAEADPIPPPKLVVDTDQPLELCVRQCIEYIQDT